VSFIIHFRLIIFSSYLDPIALSFLFLFVPSILGTFYYYLQIIFNLDFSIHLLVHTFFLEEEFLIHFQLPSKSPQEPLLPLERNLILLEET
jgi:hypothetical protein